MRNNWYVQHLELESKIKQHIFDELTKLRDEFRPEQKCGFQFNFREGDEPIIQQIVNGQEVNESIETLRHENNETVFIARSGYRYYEWHLNVINFAIIADAFEIALNEHNYTMNCID